MSVLFLLFLVVAVATTIQINSILLHVWMGWSIALIVVARRCSVIVAATDFLYFCTNSLLLVGSFGIILSSHSIRKSEPIQSEMSWRFSIMSRTKKLNRQYKRVFHAHSKKCKRKQIYETMTTQACSCSLILWQKFAICGSDRVIGSS